MLPLPGKQGNLESSTGPAKNRSVLHKVHIQLFRLCLLDAFEPLVRTVLNPVSSQSQQWIWRQHLWAILSQNKGTLSNWAQLQTWFLICHTRSRYSSTSVGLSSSNCSLPEHHISLKKMQLQAMYKPNSSCCVLSRSPGTSKHRAMQTQSSEMCPPTLFYMNAIHIIRNNREPGLVS